MPDFNLTPMIWDSWLGDDGSLIIKPTPKPRYFVRVMPWPDMRAYDYFGGVNNHNYKDLKWARCDEFPDLPITVGLESKDVAGSLSFFEKIPQEIWEVVSRYFYARFEMLEILSKHEAAVDLLKNDPHIVWILASAHRKRKYSPDEIFSILQMKRHELLSYLTGVDVQKKAVKLLRKLKTNNQTSYDALKTVVSMIMHNYKVDYFYRYWDVITPGTIRSVVTKRSHAYSKILADAVSECSLSVWEMEIDSVGQIWDTVKEVSLRIPNIVTDQEIESCTNYQQLKNLHRRWLLERDRRAWLRRLQQIQAVRVREHLLEARPVDQINHGLLDREFIDLSPEIQDDEYIVRLRTPRMMQEEGEKMRHCIFIYADQAMAGRKTYYRIRTPSGERLSMELERLTDTHYQIQQVFGAQNRHPSKKAMLFIQGWLRQRLPENVYLSRVC